MRILLFQAFITLNDTYNVVPYDPNGILCEGNAYLMTNDLVYPFLGKYSEILSDRPGLYVDSKGNHVVVDIPKKLWKEYDASNIVELDMARITKEIQENPDDFADASTIEDARSCGDLLRPTIKPEDDFLKYLIKQVILRKGVSASVYKKKFSKSHEFPNLKQSLERDTKMTVTNFKRWVDLLDLKWKLIVEDRNDPDLYKDISVSSED